MVLLRRRPRARLSAAPSQAIALPYLFSLIAQGDVCALRMALSHPDTTAPALNAYCLDRTPLMCACLLGHAEIVRCLLADRRVLPNLFSPFTGETALTTAIINAQEAVVQEFIAATVIHGAVLLNHPNQAFLSPLIVAIQEGQLRMTKTLLLNPQIDLAYEAPHHKSIQDIARQCAHCEVPALQPPCAQDISQQIEEAVLEAIKQRSGKRCRV